MINGIYEKGDKVITKDGEGVVDKDQVTKDGQIEVKLNSGETNTYAPADVSDDSDAG